MRQQRAVLGRHTLVPGRPDAATLAVLGRYTHDHLYVPMALFSFRRAKPRRFNYDPRFHDTTKDERLKRRMQASRTRVRPKNKQPAFIALGLGLLGILYMYTNIDKVVEGAASFSTFFFSG